jgi:alkanesulfonate monooxygenase SsuD/methylene tetrahydromethanopterin reductase-like flavin-dependent oxidoreductase (luciferase family)
VRFGLTFPNFGAYAEPALTVELSRAAEAGGWDGFFVWDHIVIADGFPVAEPWVLLGAIGQATESIRIGPMVSPLPRYRPWVLARQAVTLDRLSGGRCILGVGIGYPPEPDFGTFGDSTDPRLRADLLDEGLAIVTGVWSGEPFEFHGEHFDVRRTTFAPVPLQRPRIPIWVAGMLPNLRPFRRAARYDGVFPIRGDMQDMTPADVARVAGYVSRHRTGEGPFDIVVGGPPGANVDAMEEAGATWFLAGPSPEGESVEETLAWISAGPPSGP